MSSTDPYSPVEWTILTELPIRVLAAAMRADESGELGLLMQQATGITELSSRANEYSSSELVQRVFEHYKSQGDGEAQTLQLSEQWIERRSFARALDKMLRREAGYREATAVLTPRELDVVRLVAAGLRNGAIAERLRISEGTVKVHLHNIYEKTGARSRYDLFNRTRVQSEQPSAR